MRRLFLFSILLAAVLTIAQSYIVIYSEPFSEVYINGRYYGMVGISGQLTIPVDSTGRFIVTVRKTWYLPFEGEVVITSPGRVVVFATLKEAGTLRVFSNVYPVEVYSEGRYLGKVFNVQDVLSVPVGSRELTFKAEGYQEITMTVQVAPRRETTVNLLFRPKILEVNLVVSPQRFSPNDDWFEDQTTFYVYLSKPAQITVEVVDQRGQTVWRRQARGIEGTNRFVWDGKGVPDGTYTVRVRVTADDEVQEIEQYVIVDRSRYTYTKEIVLTTLIVIGILALILAF